MLSEKVRAMPWIIRIPKPTQDDDSDGIEEEEREIVMAPKKRQKLKYSEVFVIPPKGYIFDGDATSSIGTQTDACENSVNTEDASTSTDPPSTCTQGTMTDPITSLDVSVKFPNGVNANRKMGPETAQYLGRQFLMMFMRCHDATLHCEVIEDTIYGNGEYPYNELVACLMIQQIILSRRMSLYVYLFQTAIQVSPKDRAHYESVSLLLKGLICNPAFDLKLLPIKLRVGRPTLVGGRASPVQYTPFLVALAYWRPDILQFLLHSHLSSWPTYCFEHHDCPNHYESSKTRIARWEEVMVCICDLKKSLNPKQEHPAFVSTDKGKPIATTLFELIVRCMGSSRPSMVGTYSFEHTVLSNFFPSVYCQDLSSILKLDQNSIKDWINSTVSTLTSEDHENAKKIKLLIVTSKGSHDLRSWGQIDLKRWDAGYDFFAKFMKETGQFARLHTYGYGDSSIPSHDARTNSGSSSSSSYVTRTEEWYRDPNAPTYDTGDVKESRAISNDNWHKDPSKLANSIDLT